jgi:excinuclease ABC subunit B
MAKKVSPKKHVKRIEAPAPGASLKKAPKNSKSKPFKVISDYVPAGDQPAAIKQLVANFEEGQTQQVLLGVTGSGKTFTMAHVIEKLQMPTLVLAPNKTLAAQLYAELKEFFPRNAVEYFVSYYDYYQPEAYIPSTNTFIEKDSAINEQIDLMRHSATHALFSRDDVIIVSSVSCIYGIGSAEEYENMTIKLKTNAKIRRDDFLRDLVIIQYRRKDIDFHRGTFRVRGDVVEVHPAYEEDRVLRVEFFGDFIEKMSWADPLTSEMIEEIETATIFPGSHYVTSKDRVRLAIETIREELRERIQYYKDNFLLPEGERIESRTLYDLEILSEMGFCPGIENYSRHMTGRAAGEAPPTLIEYFPEKFLMIIDESHITVPQIGGMYRGDRARKMNLVQYGFRLPSALDNRPLNFQEFEKLQKNVVYVSATPSHYEMEKSGGLVIEQIIRPTGLLDPNVEVRPVTYQVDDLLKEIRIRVKKKERVLITTLTKRSAEDLTEYYESVGVKVKYLHSDIHTLQRMEILRDLRLGVFDVLIGINLLREGLDLPEVSLVAITDADKEGFLRSERSLIQTIGRAARNQNGLVILYADHVTDSMKKAMSETARRRQIQIEYNEKHGITPTTIVKKIHGDMTSIYGYEEIEEKILGAKAKVSSKLADYKDNPGSIASEIEKLRKKMQKLASQLNFEEAAAIRDEVRRLELLDLTMRDGEVTTASEKVMNGEDIDQTLNSPAKVSTSGSKK